MINLILISVIELITESIDASYVTFYIKKEGKKIKKALNFKNGYLLKICCPIDHTKQICNSSSF